MVVSSFGLVAGAAAAKATAIKVRKVIGIIMVGMMIFWRNEFWAVWELEDARRD